MIVDVRQAKMHLSKLIDCVLQGEEIVIVKAGRPVARLVPAAVRPFKRTPGSARGKIVIGPDFDAPLPRGLQCKR